MTQRRAVITGLGPITRVGIGKEALWAGLLAEKSGIGQISYFTPPAGPGRIARERFTISIRPGGSHRTASSAWTATRSFCGLRVSRSRGCGTDAREPSRPSANSRRRELCGTALGRIANAEAGVVAFIAGGSKAIN